MNSVDLFLYINKMKSDEILQLLENAYFNMNSDQRQRVFGDVISKKIASTKLNIQDAKEVLDDISDFFKESKRGDYYNDTLRNPMDTPEETSEWCNKCGIYLDQTSQISLQGFHEIAIKCFKLLFDLIDNIGNEEIFYADEAGSWMVGGDHEQAYKNYITSLANYCSPKDFVEHIVPLLKSYESSRNKIFEKSMYLGNKDQVSLLKDEVKRLKIRVEKSFNLPGLFK